MEDVPVNKITSFHGKLSQFMHSPTDAPPLSGLKSPDQSTESFDNSDRRPPGQNMATTKRTRSAPTSPLQRRIKTPRTTTMSRAQAIDPYQTHQRRSPRFKRSSTSPSATQISAGTPARIATKRKRPAPTPPKLLSLLQDTIPPSLILLLVGLNPGIMTAKTSFAYAHPSNHFWRLLHSSGITRIRHPPSDTYRLPELYSVGNTNIVERPTRNGGELSKAEMDAGVSVLEAKVAAKRPEVVCLVGKSIWESVWRVRHGRAIKKDEFRYGWQDESENMGCVPGDEWGGAPVFVATTTSGLAATMSIAEKEAVWAELGSWVVRRREEREKKAEGVATATDA